MTGLKEFVVVIFNFLCLTNGLLNFTRIKCLEFDKSFATMQACELKYVKEGDYYTIDIYTKLHQLPVNNVSLNFEILRKAKIYRPYLYNISVDFCKVMKNAKHFPLINTLVLTLASNSNVNHTCPFNHDIIMHNMKLNQNIFRRFPLTNGDYMANIRVGAYNKWRACLQFYVTVF